jgi:hypothetical protein
VIDAGERAIAGAAIEERPAAARRAQPIAKRARGGGVHGGPRAGYLAVRARRAVGAREHHAVLLTRGLRADLALERVQRDQLGLALERVAPPAAASRLDAHERAGRDRLVVDEPGQDALAGAAGIDRDPEGRSRLAAAQAPARENGAVGDAQKRAVAEHAELLEIAEPAAPRAGAARIRRERQPFDHQRKPRLRELDRQVLAVGDDVDGVGAVGVVASARPAAEHLAHEIELSVAVDAVKPGVADRLLVRGHAATDGLGEDAGEDAELAQDDERPRVGRRREHRGEQGPGRREPELDQGHDALVDVELGHALGRVGEVSQDGRQPLLEEHAVGVVAGVIDRPLRLRAGAGEVDDQAIVALGERHPLRVQARRVHTVVLGVVLPHVGAVGDLGQELAPEGLGGALENRVETGLDLLAAVALEQIAEPLGAHAAGRHLAVEVAA